MITTGDLDRRIREEGLRELRQSDDLGQALTSEEYDYDIRDLAGRGNATKKIYEHVPLGDVLRACTN